MAEPSVVGGLAFFKNILLKPKAFVVLLIIFSLLFISLKASLTFYLIMALILAIITLNGNSVMNEGGLDIASLLHFGIAVVFGVFAGFLAVLISTVVALHLSRIPTPIDFFIQKNYVKILIQTASCFLQPSFYGL